ncbi:hypothetical protein FS837_009061 [Tulasnella sp. UAMH 9824]|nr:hypothetical protein FS837_009061 [Tulasnella sp. UAMH 9824]
MAQKRNVAGTQFDDRPSKKARNAVDDDFEPSSSPPANSSQSARTPIVNPGALTRRIESEKETRNEPSVHPSTTAVQTLPKKTARRPIETCGDPGLMTHIFEKNDFSFMELKEDHVIRPLWINPADASVILEGFSPIAEQVQDFLVAIGEPISRPTFMHEYKITAYSLYAAVSIGLETNDIISVLSHLSKTPVPESIIQLIMDCTVSYGKIKLVLKRNRYHVETTDPKVLKMLLEDPIVASARVTADGMGQITSELRGLLGSADSQNAEAAAASTAPPITAGATRGMVAVNGTRNREPHTDFFASVVGAASDDNDEDDQNSHSFEVSHAKLDDVKKRCLELDYPLLEEYDFRNDTVNPQLNIDLKPLTVIRPYQEKCLGKMFSNGRARSGIIVLPCGAGKTLVGITAACTIKKTCLVLCTSGSALVFCESPSRS